MEYYVPPKVVDKDGYVWDYTQTMLRDDHTYDENHLLSFKMRRPVSEINTYSILFDEEILDKEPEPDV